MSERQEKKKRYNQRLKYIAEFNRWLEREPPKWKLITWIKWKRQMPRWEET